MTSSKWIGEIDEPADILENAVLAQRLLLSGFGGNPNVDKRKFREAQEPKHCAISLAGEPTMYPKINTLIEDCGRLGLTSFVVTNGMHPEVLEHMVKPTQLYISLVAPDQETYKMVCRPFSEDGWEKLSRSLELMSSFDCRTVIRLTLVKGFNFKNPEGYAKIIEKTGSDFVEVKAYMCVGFSRRRLGMNNMPLHGEIKAFTEELARETGYSIIDESEQSRVVLMKK